MLARRLARHGLPVTGGALAALLSQGARASIPAPVAYSTIKAAGLIAAGQAAGGVISATAAQLAEGVLKTMLLNKLKIATALLLVLVILGTGAAALTRQAPASKPADAAVKEKKDGEKSLLLVRGVVAAVAAEKNTITFDDKAPAALAGKTVPVAKDADLRIDGKAARLVALPAGASLELTLSADQQTVRRIQAAGAQFYAVPV
jgi:hypothetical protein